MAWLCKYFPEIFNYGLYGVCVGSLHLIQLWRKKEIVVLLTLHTQLVTMMVESALYVSGDTERSVLTFFFLLRVLSISCIYTVSKRSFERVFNLHSSNWRTILLFSTLKQDNFCQSIELYRACDKRETFWHFFFISLTEIVTF